MLELKNIITGYGDKIVLNDITTAIDPLRITVVMGPNGCGKTTMLKTIMGLLRPMSGDIIYGGANISPNPQTWIKHGVFMIGQGGRVFSKMTVRENIEIACHHWDNRGEFPARLNEVIQHFPDLYERLDDAAGNLSGGQQQMVALARGLVNRPRLLLLDEPSIGLAPKLISDTFGKLHDINKKTGTGFIIIEHNLKTLLPLTDRAIILAQGKIAYDGASDDTTLQSMIDKIF